MFGTGKAAITILKKLMIPIEYYVDNDSNKWENCFFGRKVLNPNTLKNEEKGNFIILVASMFYDEISIQLENMGFNQLSDYYNAMDLFINPLNYEPLTALSEENSRIEIKVKNFIKMDFFEDAKMLLLEYKTLFPFDDRIEYLKALIMLKEGRLHKVEEFLNGRIEFGHINYEINHNYILANSFLKKGNYIEALEMYEKLAIGKDNFFCVGINSIISELEQKHSLELKNELKVQKKIKKTGVISGYNLHLMFDHFYCKHFIEVINKTCNNNIFIVFCWHEDAKYITKDISGNVIMIRIEEPYYYSILPTIQSYIDKSKQVFIHYLHDLTCWLLYHCRVNIPISWIVWGADLYSYISESLYDETTEQFLTDTGCKPHMGSKPDNDKIVDMIYRKSIIRRLDNILTWNKGDYNKIIENYITAAEQRYFIYNIPVDFTILDSIDNRKQAQLEFKHKYRYVLLLGNSGDPTNNHIKILNILSSIERDDFCVVAPLSYGNEVYIKNLVKEGERILGSRFIPLTDFLEPERYAEVLSQVDAVLMNHNRQQGVGNMLALLYLGKKIYMNTNVTTYFVFSNMGIKLFDIKDIGKSSLEEIVSMDNKIADANRKLVSDAFSNNMGDSFFKEYFC